MSDPGELPLAEGATSALVAEVQDRLAALGISSGDQSAVFGASTTAAVQSFQRRRGLPINGIVDGATWHVLVEAGYQLGSRDLTIHSPMLRGDDVADLQQQLAALGFDAGRVDGIYGPLTANAVAEFQRNSGLAPTAVADSATVAALSRVTPRRDTITLVTAVREAEVLRGDEVIVALGDLGSMEPAVVAFSASLANRGVAVHRLRSTGESPQAAEANALGAHCYIGLRAAAQLHGYRTAFYKGYSSASSSGERLALALADAIPAVGSGGSVIVQGMATPILRETQMTAVVVDVGVQGLNEHDVLALSANLSKGFLDFRASAATSAPLG